MIVYGLIGLSACQEQRTTVVEASANANLAAPPPVVARPPARPVVLSPCTAPAGSGPYEHIGTPLSHGAVHPPPRAVAEHVRGCAGIRFRIGPDGAPHNLVVLAEYPAGYGFGAAGTAWLNNARWPARDDEAWRYLVLNINP